VHVNQEKKLTLAKQNEPAQRSCAFLYSDL
jgi:hypothetical protein